MGKESTRKVSPFKAHLKGKKVKIKNEYR